MTKDITLTGFTVEELEPSVRTKVLDKYRDFSDIDAQELTNDFKDILRADGLVVDEVYWSLSNCQGDGVAFTVKNLDLDILKTNPDFNKWVKRFEELELDLNIEIDKVGRYSHYHSMGVSIACSATRSSGDIPVTDEIEAELEDFRRDLLTFIKVESTKLEKIGYEYIEDYSSDEYVSDCLIANDMYFTASGQLIPKE